MVLRQAQETHKSKVYEIILSGCAISKIENIEAFTQLRILDLSCNAIEQIENISFNKELRELRLYSNKIKEIVNLDQLKKLSVLKLQDNDIKTVGMFHLVCFPSFIFKCILSR